LRPADYLGSLQYNFFSQNPDPTPASDEERNVGDFSLENTSLENTRNATDQALREENSATRAKRLAEQMRFRLRESTAQRGSSEAFLHWLRSDTEKHA
jgi:hypothetical protein